MQLNEVLGENNGVKSQRDMEMFYKSLLSPEKTYKKRQLTFDVEIANEPKNVTTIIDGEEETTNKANKGDYILTGSKGEKYVLTPEKFNKRYVMVGSSKAKTKPVKIKAKEYTQNEQIRFMADWGEQMILNKGDFLVNNNGEFYRIEKEAFHNTYEEA